jgi:cupin fold WbuC family metalloprotein
VTRHRVALDPPAGAVARITPALLDQVSAAARQSPRRRMIQPFHKDHADPLHRMLNAMEPGTYVRPHRHLDPPKAEAWILLRGALDFYVFEDDGRVREKIPITPDGTLGVDLAPGVYHSLVARAPGTLVYEVKTGPYVALSDKAFAPWAPPEGDPAVAAYLSSLP